jgi:DNA ligase-1
MSEKLDGIRAYWNGRILSSRHSKEIFCPKWFTDGLPQHISLDGELWLGRGTYELLQGELKGDNPIWKNISFIVFDIPNSKEIYEVRIRDMENLKLPSHVRIIETQRCINNGHLQNYLAEILKAGGEGVMVMKPKSIYTPQRTNTLLKVKV